MNVQEGQFEVQIPAPPSRAEVVAKAMELGYPAEYAEAHADISLACYGRPVHVLLPLICVQLASCADAQPGLEGRNHVSKQLRKLADDIDAQTMDMIEANREESARPIGPTA